jgi:N-acyl-phosphatidylethanolamine-hydrolysing phospholipase D
MMVSVTPVVSLLPQSSEPPAHHVGSPPSSFINPWPSFDTSKQSLLNIVKAKFGRDRPKFIPIPGREELVPVRKPAWGAEQDGLKVTWIGHASFLIETTRVSGAPRGVRILCDPVFSERTSPVQFLGPKRYTPTPCSLEELPDVDAVIISHNHYDHLDHATIMYLHKRRKGEIHFFCALGNASWFLGCGIAASQVTELDWWDGVDVNIGGVGRITLTCTPSQHFSGRSGWDRGSTLWCSWVVQEVIAEQGSHIAHKLYFAGDTGYRTVAQLGLSHAEEAASPHCPAFAEIGNRLGPFDLALLPIGLCQPRPFMSGVHCDPYDSICIHKDIKSKKSIGMHWGTIRGGVSQEYEDVRDPPKWWREAAEQAGLKWGEEIGLLDVGETLVLS